MDAETPATTMNDGKCDQLGRLWVGTWDRDGGSRATLSVVDLDGSVRVAEDGLSASNGLAWNADSSVLYLVDTPRRVIWRYDFALREGELGAREVFVRLDDEAGLPDGLATDEAGGVWVALFKGGAVHRYDADGALTHVVPVPVTYPTSLAFGGSDLRTVFVTTGTAHAGVRRLGTRGRQRPRVPVGRRRGARRSLPRRELGRHPSAGASSSRVDPRVS